MNKHQNICRDSFKISVIGCGNVGATAAYSMMLSGLPNELVLIDQNKDRAEGLKMDFEHSLSFLPFLQLKAGKDLKLTAGSDLIVVTAGARQKDGQTRLELIAENRKIFQALIPQLAKHSPKAILLIVSNPVDIMTHLALKLSKFPRERVFGSGTMLDTIRFQYHISEHLKINPRDIQAFILGEHGDSSFPVWSSANIAGKSIFQFQHFDKKTAAQCYDKTRTAAYHIIHDLGFTCYSIAIVIREIMRAIYENAHIVVPLSVELQGEYGLKNVTLSIPCVLGSGGIMKKIEIPLSAAEKKSLRHSAQVLQKLL